MTDSVWEKASEPSAVDIARMVRGKEVSALEVVDAAIARIEARNPAINAVTFKGYDDARQAAGHLQRRIMAGDEVGIMAGVPTLMKDLFGFKPGWPATTGGLTCLKDNIATGYSTFPKRVEDADAIILGMTNSPAYGFRGTTHNGRFGVTRNPFDLSRNPGGSSGGSAAAVADGLVPVAGATDGGGSIRIPSAWSGTVGFQASAGRVPFLARPNAFGESFYLYEGPITKTVADCALAVTAMNGFSSRDPNSLPGRMDLRPAVTAGIRGKRIGLTLDFGIFPVHRAVRERVQEKARVFESLGAVVEEAHFQIPHSHTELTDFWSQITAIQVYDDLQDMKARGIDPNAGGTNDLPDEMMRWVDNVPRLGREYYHTFQLARTRVFDAFADVFEKFDYVVAPTVASNAVLNAKDGLTLGPSVVEGEAVDPLIGWCMTYLTNYTGNPSASIPAGLTDGLPVGMMVIGKRGDDYGVMSAIAAYEMGDPWSWIYEVPMKRRLAR